jgi:RNA-splicing ligase RtcB
MLEIEGKFNKAKVFTSNVDEASKDQIKTLCDQEFTQGSKIRLMPDVHAGMGCTIGTTMTIIDKIVPNLVGVDIGCGMETVIIDKDHNVARNFDPEYLDKIIKLEIPCGREVRDTPHQYNEQIDLSKLKYSAANIARAKNSIGSLGGGNHFIEVDKDDEGNLYIVVHSGSRHLGQEVANHYQEEAYKQLNNIRDADIALEIARLKEQGKTKEIQSMLKNIRSRVLTNIPKDLAYVSGELFDDYIHDMQLTQKFASLNRKAMIEVIMNSLGLDDGCERFTTVHNYIDTSLMILRKGSVSALAGQKLLIPINMRDGSLICEGLGNEDWNYSAPHGAGRIMSRKKAFSTLDLEEYKKSMEGIYSSCITKNTLDESPMAYKNMDEILENIKPTARVLKVIKPIYNFKAAE